MEVRYKPSSSKVLCAVNLAFVYGGGLYIYMGSSVLTNVTTELLQPTPMLASAYIFVIAGVLIALGGVGGNFLVFNRNEKNLTRHYWLLMVLLGLFLLSTALSLALFLLAKSSLLWKMSMASAMSENYVKEVCPDVLGYFCHGAPTSLLSTSNQFASPQYNLICQHRYCDGVTVGSRAGYTEALQIPGDPSAPFFKLCENVTGRMKLLPPVLAFNLNSSCQMCADVRPVKTKTPVISNIKYWSNREAGYAVYTNFVDYGGTKCITRLFDGKYPIATYYSTYDGEFILETWEDFYPITDLKSHWVFFAQAMSIASACFSVVVILHLHEVQRTLSEFMAQMI